ncbi:MAG: hypothetical protein S4CHLAM6_12990 [Chlamydiae bacterium]|nr:hypothetical protein [Chlamydiota bacterium]
MHKKREHWATRAGFLLATAGSAIGLGSLWRFPYMAGENGGGYFVLLFIGFTFLIGLPVFMAELTMGRRSQRGPVLAFTELAKNSHIWRLVGWLAVITTFVILSYYLVISGWSLNYAFMSLNQFYKGKSYDEIVQVFDIVYKSPQMNVFWLFIFMIMTGGIVFGGVRKGIEKWSRILMPALFIILVGLFINSMTLSGAGQAFKFIFSPRGSALSATTVLNALGMAFFALSVGLGVLITYGSYMHSNDDIPKTALIIALLDISVSLLAALMIFPIIFTYGFQPQEGVGLIFKVLPVLFAQMPGALLISTVFFLLIVFTALTSTISLLEVLVATSMETFNWTRKKSAILASCAVFIFALPSALSGAGKFFPLWEKVYGKNFFETFDYLTGSWFLPLSGILTAVFVGWAISPEMRKKEFIEGSKYKWVYVPWLLILKYIAPLAIVLIILNKSNLVNIDAFFCRN